MERNVNGDEDQDQAEDHMEVRLSPFTFTTSCTVYFSFTFAPNVCFRKKTRPGCLCCPREAQRWVPTCLIPTSSRSLSKGATDFNFQEKIVFKGERKSSTLQRKYSRVTEPEPRTQKQEFQAYSTDQQTSAEQNQEDDSSSMDYRVCLFFSFDIVSLFMESIRKVLSFLLYIF